MVWMAATARRRKAVLLGVAVCLLSAGCHKRIVVPTLPPVLKTPEVQPPAPESPSMEAPPPDSITHAPTVRVVEKKPVRRAKKSSKNAAGIAPPPATETAAAALPAPAPAAAVLGELTTGGEVSPKTQQDTVELIAADERRLQAVAGTKAKDQVAQLKEVRHFLDQAKEVLATGDAEGAKTLATKAKLLIDDLEKWAAK